MQVLNSKRRRVGGRYVPPVIVIGRKLVPCGPWISPRGRNGSESMVGFSAGNADALPDVKPELESLTECGCQWDAVEAGLTPEIVQRDRLLTMSLRSSIARGSRRVSAAG